MVKTRLIPDHLLQTHMLRLYIAKIIKMVPTFLMNKGKQDVDKAPRSGERETLLKS